MNEFVTSIPSQNISRRVEITMVDNMLKSDFRVMVKVVVKVLFVTEDILARDILT